MPICLSVCLFTCPSTCLFVYLPPLSVYSFTSPSAYLSTVELPLSVYLHISQLPAFLSARKSIIYVFVCLSVYLHVHLPVYSFSYLLDYFFLGIVYLSIYTVYTISYLRRTLVSSLQVHTGKRTYSTSLHKSTSCVLFRILYNLHLNSVTDSPLNSSVVKYFSIS